VPPVVSVLLRAPQNKITASCRASRPTWPAQAPMWSYQHGFSWLPDFSETT